MSNTFSNGCLGSHTDEERSEMRYVMRIAKSVSHQNFERILHFLYGEYVCWSVCSSPPSPLLLKSEDPGCSPPLLSIYLGKRVQMKTQSYNRSFSVLHWWDARWYHNASSLCFNYKAVWAKVVSQLGPPISQEYPLNLSILIGGGKETNQDSLSNCEWSGKSSDWKSSEL